jgi:hypothetical protein
MKPEPAAIVRQAEADEQELVRRGHELTEQANTSSWEMADVYLGLYCRGWTHQEIADEFSTPQRTIHRSTVTKCITCAEKFPRSVLNMGSSVHNRPAFWNVFSEENSEKKPVHVSQATGMPEWYTPDEYLDAAREVLGGIDLDPATSKIAQKRVRAGAFYTARDDGLSKHWKGRVWLNPPYDADLVGKFVGKLCEHYGTGDVPAALLLVNNATETGWFQQAAGVASAICFPEGRVHFLDEDDNPSGAPLQGQAVVYFGTDVGAFRKAYDSFGKVCEVLRE